MPMPNEIKVQQYRPSEIIAIFNELLSRQTAQQSANLVYIRGIYLASGTYSYNGGYFDKLRDEDKQDELTIFVSAQQRQGLSSGNLVEIGGTLGRKIDTKGYIQLIFNVSRIDVVQDQVIDEDEVKRFKLREKKVSQGFKNVDNTLESLLFNDKQPRIALLLAASSITLTDFEAGINAAKVALQFHQERVTFSRTQDLCNKLKSLDSKGFDAIALVRGGGIDPTTDVDKPEVIETVVKMNTPFICSVGHGEEKIFLRQVSDKWTATPQGLGQYLSELVESVSEKKSKSRAAITEQIKKQFQQQLETGKKQNQELQKKLEDLTKVQMAAQKQHKEQIDAANKQNKSLQDQLKTIQKTNKDQIDKLNDTHNKQLTKLNQSQTQLQEQLKKQQAESNRQAEDLNKTLSKMTTQNEQLSKQLLSSQKELAELKAGGNNNTILYAVIAVLICLLIIAAIL